MPDPATLGFFVVAALVLLVTPGPAVLYIVARSVEQGRTAGLVSTLGIHVGTLAHVAAAALGISALLVSSALAFGVVKYLGAAYLVYLGVRKLTARGSRDELRVLPPQPLRRIFLQGGRRQRPEPEDRALLPGLLAAVRRRGSGPGGPPDPIPGGPVHRPRPLE